MQNKYQDIIHPSDRKALEALKAVPGFDTVVKTYMNVLGEQMYKIENTSSYLKLGPNQLPEIYDILVRVCNKLGIYPIPDLFLSLNREPNAGTYGDTDIFIVLNSGLFETLSLKQIETIIAHECGHIICRHTLYHTMGKFIMNGVELFANGILSKAVISTLQYAYAYWERCSEFSADRVSALYHDSAEPVVDVMMALAGGTPNLKLNLNVNEFLKQAKDYKALVDESTYNKVLEFVRFGDNSHPLNAYRAYEINEFYKKYQKKLTYNNPDNKTEYNVATVDEYELKIRFEYKNSGAFLNGIFEQVSLEIMVDDNVFVINKNSSCTFDAISCTIDFIFKVNDTQVAYSYNVAYDSCLVVVWDDETKEITIREEI